MTRPAIALLVATACAACSTPTVPSTPIVRGEFVDAIQAQGELKASRSLTLRAPSEAGELRIVQLVPGGTLVKKGTVIAEFDTSTVARTLDEKRTEVNALQAEIEKARAEAGTKEAETLTAESTARFDVERAKLDYSGRDALSRVEAEQRRLKIIDAEQKLREATARLASARAEARANVAAATHKRVKAQRDLDRAAVQLGALRITAPADGTLNVILNPRGPFFQRQPFKAGDQVWPGAEIAQLPDPSSLYVSTRLDEVERGRLALGQPVTVRVEGLPDRELNGRVKSISALAKTDFTTWPPPRNFDVAIELNDADPRLRPGMTATLRIAVERLKDVLIVPAEAVFEREGETVVYVLNGSRPERRPITVDRRSTDRVVVRAGVNVGELVSLSDPLEERKGTR